MSVVCRRIADSFARVRMASGKVQSPLHTGAPSNAPLPPEFIGGGGIAEPAPAQTPANSDEYKDYQ
ncbi:MAG: hypothetical protein WC003_08720 [Terrimicrobiaceae bacterium]